MVALDEGLPPLDWKQGDEEEAQVVVGSFRMHGKTAAIGAGLGLLAQGYRLWLYTTDQEEHGMSPLSNDTINR